MEQAVEAGIEAAEKTLEYDEQNVLESPSYEVNEKNGVSTVEVSLDTKADDTYVQTYIEAEREAAAELYTQKNNEFVAEHFKARDTSVTYVSKYSPCVFAELSITKIVELIEVDEVIGIGYGGMNVATNSSSSTEIGPLDDAEIRESLIAVNAMYPMNYYKLTGEGIGIGQIENTCPTDSNVKINAEFCRTDEARDITHANNVYAIMSAMAPEADYYAVGRYCTHSYTYGNFYEQMEWLLSKNLNIINMSLSLEGKHNTYTDNARWIDHIAYNHNVHVVIASGNGTSGGSLEVTNPGMAYNAITVGSTSRTSPYNISDFSCYNGDGAAMSSNRTFKPDIVAPGEYTADSGTSYSAPLVTAAIALLCEYEPTLKTRPFAVKAILAANTNTVRNYVTTDSEFAQYGAGLLNLTEAIYAINWERYSDTSIELTTQNQVKTQKMSVSASEVSSGKMKRVAISYGNYIQFADGVSHELNEAPAGALSVVGITIYAPDGSYVKGLTSNSGVYK